MKKVLKSIKNNFSYLIIFGFALVLMLPLFRSVFCVTDDGIFHILNIKVIGENINFSSGNFFPDKIMPLIGNDLGYGINLFYSNFPHILTGYIYNFLSNFNIGVIGAIKVAYLFIVFFAGLFMYIFTLKIFKNKIQALTSSVFYMALPYFFVDLFMRGAFNECFIFIFVPIVFLSIYYLFEEENIVKFYISFIVGFWGMINSHLVLTVFFVICFSIYLLINYKKTFKKKSLVNLTLASVTVLGLSAPFFTGLLEHYIFGNYFVENNKYEVSDIWCMNFIELFLTSYYKSSANTLIFIAISSIMIPFLLLGGVVLFKKNYSKAIKKNVLFLIIFTILPIILLCIKEIWNIMPYILRNLQFAFRLVIFINFVFCIISSMGIMVIKKEYRKYALGIIMVFLALGNFYYMKSVDFQKIDLEETRIDYTNGMGWQKEYLPQNAKDNSEYILFRNHEIYTESKNVNINIIDRQNEKIEFVVENLSENDKIEIELPKLYYLGYNLIDENKEKINLYENSNGLLACEVDKNGKYVLEYAGTIGDQIAKIIRIFTIIIITGLIINKLMKRKK